MNTTLGVQGLNSSNSDLVDAEVKDRKESSLKNLVKISVKPAKERNLYEETFEA